jgi:hypothetical protein
MLLPGLRGALVWTKYPDIIWMPLGSWRLYPGSAAILAASEAGETPALPGKTMQEFVSGYLEVMNRFLPCLELISLWPCTILRGSQHYHTYHVAQVASHKGDDLCLP